MKLKHCIFFGIACLAGGATSGVGCSASDSPPATSKGGSGNNGGSANSGSANGGSSSGGSANGGSSSGGSANGGSSSGGSANGGSSSGGSANGGSSSGGSENTGGTGNTGGSASTGGTGNTGGSASTGDGGEDVASCVAQSISNTGTTEACATCTCTKCADTSHALANDPAALALDKCGIANHCAGDCCFCNNNNGTPCSTVACGGYAQGPCVAETSAAAGFDLQSMSTCFTDGMNLGAACKTGPSSCHNAREFAICVQQNCVSECNAPPACGLI